MVLTIHSHQHPFPDHRSLPPPQALQASTYPTRFQALGASRRAQRPVMTWASTLALTKSHLPLLGTPKQTKSTAGLHPGQPPAPMEMLKVVPTDQSAERHGVGVLFLRSLSLVELEHCSCPLSARQVRPLRDAGACAKPLGQVVLYFIAF